VEVVLIKLAEHFTQPPDYLTESELITLVRRVPGL
jgi:DNA topoisomerase IA